MGRAKLKMELICKEKERNATFKKRKEGLLKKLYEFTTLCNVDGLMILYGPNGSDPEIWTNSSGNSSGGATNSSLQQEEMQKLIDQYKKESNLQSGSTKTFDLSDYFVDRNKKVEEELMKLRKMNMEKRYPSWSGFMDRLSEIELRQVLTSLDYKVAEVKSRINSVRGNFPREYLMGGETTRLSQFTHMVQGGIELGGYNYEQLLQVPIYPYCNYSHQEMMMLTRTENNWQYNNNGASSSSTSGGIGNNNMMCAALYEATTTHNMMGNNQLTYGAAAPTILPPPPCIIFPMSQMQQHSWNKNEQDDNVKFLPY
ncbi:hypothetical protein CQW23_20417 [Capsicum baccatum]|uniref:MADS-box domain-containing protein n=1 Tax=Capsicum baccatum TaxID=33114 RepID=A0A2G2W8J6_CAPBA|nr:hypothetical protein CQW23_20417 [Capsicum baccatum]